MGHVKMLQDKKKQLVKMEVDWSGELSIIKIHTEKMIGVLKQKFNIFQSVLPIALGILTMMMMLCTIDKLVQVCCALVNLMSLYCLSRLIKRLFRVEK